MTNALHGPIIDPRSDGPALAYANLHSYERSRLGYDHPSNAIALGLARARAHAVARKCGRVREEHIARAVWAGCGWEVDVRADWEHLPGREPDPLFYVFCGPSLVTVTNDRARAEAEWRRLVMSRPAWVLRHPEAR